MAAKFSLFRFAHTKIAADGLTSFLRSARRRLRLHKLKMLVGILSVGWLS